MKYKPDYPPKQEREKTPEEKIDDLMRSMAVEINAKIIKLTGHSLVEEKNNRIRPNFFSKKEGGPYVKTRKVGEVGGEDSSVMTIQEDNDFVRMKISGFSGAHEESEQKRLGVVGETKEDREQQVIDLWREKKENSKETQVEKIITFLLYKFLRERGFLVVRTAEYDDYEHSVDTLIIDENTGEVVGSFDEVLDSFNPEDVGVKSSSKWQKILEKNVEGRGAKIKYGLTFEVSEKGKKLVRRELHNVPVFFLSLSSKDFEELLTEINSDINAAFGDAEIEIFNKLIESLGQQADGLLKENPPTIIKEKIDKLQKTLIKIRQ